MEIDFILRKPTYPLICDIDGKLFVAKSKSELKRKLSKFQLDSNRKYDIIDFTGKAWKLDPRLEVISPIIFSPRKKAWSKQRLVDLYNSSQYTDIKYSDKSLPNKRYEIVFLDLVELISKAKRK